MKIALYARVSTTKQDNENQLVQLRHFAEKQGWAIVDNYIDQESGSTSDRPEFQRMFADASKRKFDLVLFWSLDRLSREGVLETLQHLNRLTSYGVGFRSYTEQFFDSCGIFKDAIIAIMATLAKQERVKRSERTRAGLARVRATGKSLGRPRVIVNTAQIAALRDSGASWASICKKTGLTAGTARRAFTSHAKNQLSRAAISA
jgi:DNA invertase Pin-like site-specific DNA recombinase